MPNLNMFLCLALTMSLSAEGEGVMDSLWLGPSYMATMSFTVWLVFVLPNI